MPSDLTNILLIGFGHHAKRIYYPILRNDGEHFHARLACIVDLQERRVEIESYLRQNNDAVMDAVYVSSANTTSDELLPSVSQKLDEAVRQFGIQGVIISTEPLSHLPYARWALRNGLSTLMDKPISTRKAVSTSEVAADDILRDYDELLRLYTKAKDNQPAVRFSVTTQRRYHPVFCKAKELVREVFEKTNCPITSIQSFHADGQWWLPTETVETDYHPVNVGYGKCSHSGYHFFDMIQWLMEAAESGKKRANNVDVFVNFTRPLDFLTQLNLDDYRRLFADFDKHNRYDEGALEKLSAAYGEIDAFCSFAFKRDDRTVTLGSLNLVHNGFSQRGWVTTMGKDLYKGNGRVRQESHFIEQGPFQSICIRSNQSKEVDPSDVEDLYGEGGEYHCDLHVFRNTNLFPEWRRHDLYSVKDLDADAMQGKSRGHQEAARRRAVLELLRSLEGEQISPISDLATHRRGVVLMSAAYKSAARRLSGGNPLVNVIF
jgi:predicted dehydrogenase